VLRLNFEKGDGSPRKLLCLGAHADDIEIGCGGTLLRLCEERDGIEVRWVVFAASGPRAAEARLSASLFLEKAYRKTVTIKHFKDSFFPFQGARIKEYCEDLKASFSPDLIFTHYRGDLHQDHRFISEVTWSTFRDHLILEYEVVKYDGDLGNPNFFIGLDTETCRRKINALLTCFKTQAARSWFSEETFLSILKLRGIESNVPGTYAEGYYCRKMVFRG
jgi:LmbE family N-acetylglucosaminyl deacetylase